jgi:hypothetical protein
MFAVLKKSKQQLKADYKLYCKSEAVELLDLSDVEWSLVSWDSKLAGADVLNEIMETAPDSRFFDSPDDEKGKEGVNSFVRKNFKSKEKP